MVIAFDFDGTVCEHAFPQIGDINYRNRQVIENLKQAKAKGDTLILWTCRVGELLDDAVSFCVEHGISPDFVNENTHRNKILYGNDCRKILADIYMDDKAVNPFCSGCGSVILRNEVK
jgi:hypothetical protein